MKVSGDFKHIDSTAELNTKLVMTGEIPYH